MPLNSEFLKKIDELRRKAPEVVKRLPGIAKVEGLRFIADNFEHEGFETNTGQYKAWPNRKTKKTKKKGIGEKRGGSLKSGWKGQEAAGKTEFENELPYAQIQNEGGRTPAHKIYPVEKKALKTPYGVFKSVNHPGSEIPASPMIGPSLALDNRIENKLDRLVEEMMK